MNKICRGNDPRSLGPIGQRAHWGKHPWPLGPAGQLGEADMSTRSNPAVPNLGSGVAKPDRGGRVCWKGTAQVQPAPGPKLT